MRGDSLKERILRVATIEEVVAAYVPLQRSGAGYVGLCPFHADKHPSLHVHPGKQFFKCFACGEGGDLFAFVQKIEGCSFTEAMGKLAKRYSIDSREWTVDNYAGKKKRTDGKGTTGKRTAGSSDKTANENSDDQLSVRLPVAALRAGRRGFEGDVPPFRGGDRSSGSAGGLPEDAVAVDLPDPGREGRAGGVCGRRRTDGEEGAKYVNSPASPVYSKSPGALCAGPGGGGDTGEAVRLRHRRLQRRLGDACRGFTNTVALCGVAFTAGHLRLLAGYTQRIVRCWMPTGRERRRWKRSWRCSRAGQTRKGSGWSRPVCSK